MSDQVQPLTMQEALEQTLSPDFNQQPIAEVAEVTNVEPIVEGQEVVAEVANTQPAIIEEEIKPAAIPAFDELAWIKQHFGNDIDSVDTLKSKINALAPEPIIKEIEYANEESKQLATLIAAGKTKEVKKFLDEQDFYSSASQLNDDDIIKSYYQKEFGLSPAQVERKFQKDFGIDELLDDEDKAIEQKVTDARKAKEAAAYREQFTSKIADIKLPSIEAPAPASAEQPVETEQAKKAFLFSAELNKTASVDTDNIPFTLKDDTRGIDYKGQIPLPQAEIDGIQNNIANNEAKWIEARYIKTDGTFDERLFARDVYVITNLPKIANAISVDAKEQTWKAKLMQDKNYSKDERVVQGDFEPSKEQQDIVAFESFWNQRPAIARKG